MSNNSRLLFLFIALIGIAGLSYVLFFDENNKDSFIDAVKKLNNTKPIEKEIYNNFSLSKRSKKIIEFARLEGLEPPTL